MDFNVVLGFVSSIGLIFAGIYIKNSNKVEMNKFKKYWLFYVIGGAFLFSFKVYKYLN
jgi:flagellar motor component MotA